MKFLAGKYDGDGDGVLSPVLATFQYQEYIDHVGYSMLFQSSPKTPPPSRSNQHTLFLFFLHFYHSNSTSIHSSSTITNVLSSRLTP